MMTKALVHPRIFTLQPIMMRMVAIGAVARPNAHYATTHENHFIVAIAFVMAILCTHHISTMNGKL